MARDKARDDKFFNCSERHEFRYVSSLYGDNKVRVFLFLKKQCRDGAIKYSTHKEVYDLINRHLNYPVPN
jgi:hypothetical protein